LLSVFNDALLKLEDLVRRLPGPVQKAVLSEIRPLRELFLEQRPPRILLMGDPGIPESMLVRGLFGRVLPADSPVQLRPVGPAWSESRRAGRGAVRVMDLRGERSDPFTRASRALAEEVPDAVLFIQEDPAPDREQSAALDALEAVLTQAEQSGAGRRVPVLGIAICGAVPIAQARDRMRSALFSRMAIAERTSFAEAYDRSALVAVMGETEGAPEFRSLLVALFEALPNASKVEMVRITRLREAQTSLANLLTRSATAVCGVVGTQPIPLADLPILTSIQLAMVAGIIHVSGRDLTAKVVLQFLGALGLNVGLGMVFREGARAVVKILPGWGNAVSGMVAAAGTFSIGKAAAAYFIEGISMEGARKVFRARRRALERAPDVPRGDS
jgi:uncharacterized protein (DUF697 family)